MHDNKSSNYSNIIFLILLVFSFVLVVSDLAPSIKLIKNFVYYIVYPSSSMANEIFKYSGTFADNIKSLIYLKQENIVYKQVNQELTDQLRNYKTITTQYENLVELLKIPKIKNTQSVFARISVREPNEWYQWFIIDKGANHGLYNNLAVTMLNDKGELCAVGRIIETYPSSSKVALITNPLSAIPVQIKNKKINCLAEGFGSNLLKISYIPLNADIKVGDEIVASPLSSVFQQGMPIATIKSVSKEPTSDFQTALAEIRFESDTLYEAIILLPREK